MRKLIFLYFFIAAAFNILNGQSAQAQLPDATVPKWLQSYKDQLWNPQGLLTLAGLTIGGCIILGGDSSSKKNRNGRMASAHWARKKESGHSPNQ
jgi:hypothetical protein